MHKFFYISLLLLFFVPDVRAQKKYIYQDSSLLQKEEQYPAVDSAVEIIQQQVEATDKIAIDEVIEKPDTALYANNISLSADSIRHWKKLKDYAYIQYIDSLLKEKKKKKVKEPDYQPTGTGILNGLLNSGFIKFLLWAFAIGFVLFIIYRLFLAEAVFLRKSKSMNNGEAEVEEELITSDSDFDVLIKQALQNNNYRQAVRYQYLRTLHTLAAKGFVELAPDKTNFQYVSEIKNRDYQNDFAALTLHYEYVWYGEFAIEQDIYHKIETGFINLNKKL